MAGNTIEERLARLEEQLEALKALTQGIAAWELGTASPPKLEQAVRSARPNHDDESRRQPGEPRART
jgi:hypothetical protein